MVRKGDKLHTKGLVDHAGAVRLDPFEVFRPTGEFTIGKPAPEDAVAQRTLDLLGRTYDLFGFNCEHAANLAQTGSAESPQLWRWVLGLLATEAVALAAPRIVSAIKTGSVEYDSSVDRNRHACTKLSARS